MTVFKNVPPIYNYFFVLSESMASKNILSIVHNLLLLKLVNFYGINYFYIS
jgi:hypothetical protein